MKTTFKDLDGCGSRLPSRAEDGVTVLAEFGYARFGFVLNLELQSEKKSKKRLD
jgi:hypothetical protein